MTRGTLRAPMHELTPAEHASMGWAHGQYKDGLCLSLMAPQSPEGVAEFISESSERGALYIALCDLPEYAK